MFEAVEVGQKVDKATFAAAEPELRTGLLTAQREIAARAIPVIVVVAGIEGAGKGAVVNRLYKWLDTRRVTTHSFWDPSSEEDERPRYWRFWRRLPRAGRTAILFGSWYTQPIVERVRGDLDRPGLEGALHRAAQFERMLTDDGTLLIKLWFHLTAQAQRKRLEKDVESGFTTSPLLEQSVQRYRDVRAAAELAIAQTDTDANPWHLVEASDKRHRDLTTGQLLLRAMQERLARADETATAPPASATAATPANVLDSVDLSQRLDEATYDIALDEHRVRLNALAWRAREQQRRTVLVFEGPDAAGKGGAIRRLASAVDARLLRVVAIAAPTDEERAHHYLWRFWRHVPRAGRMIVFDRSWYGRVLVERVEGFARADEWQRAYQEINEFESQLVENGDVLAKFWLHIDQDEQLRRFEDRQRLPWKQHKITPEDWRNRERWPDYAAAVHDMVQHTSTGAAPWHLVPGNDKRFARIEVLKTLCDRLEAALDRP